MRAICKSGSMSGAGNGAMVGAVTHRRTKGAESSWGLAGKRSAERRRHCVSVGLVGHVGIAIQELFKGHHDLMPFQAGRRAIDFLSGKRTAPNAPEPHSLVAYRFAVGAEDEMSEESDYRGSGRLLEQFDRDDNWNRPVCRRRVHYRGRRRFSRLAWVFDRVDGFLAYPPESADEPSQTMKDGLSAVRHVF